MTISDEAVEAAAKAMVRISRWEDVSGSSKMQLMLNARLALEAASPHMLAGEREAARISREQARKLEAVTSIAVGLEGSAQGKDRQLAEELYAAIGLT